jgi:proteasome lid subunit RPN8/RPN11
MMELSANLWKQLVRHAREALPYEAIGFLAGRNGRSTAAIPLPNIAPRGKFLADPYAQFLAERRIQREGLELLAIYHSHPGGGTQLSPFDIEFAKERACLHVVIALDAARPGHEVAAAYAVQASKARAVAIEITRQEHT